MPVFAAAVRLFSASSRRPSVDLEGFLLTLSDHDHVNVLADQGLGHDARQITHFRNGLAVELDDHVTGLDAGGFRRTAFGHVGNQGTFRIGQVERLGQFIGDGLDPDTKPAATGLAEFAQLLDHRHGGRRRDRENRYRSNRRSAR